MEFSWSPEKARRNLAKHGVSFEAALRVFADPHVFIVEDCEDEHGEMRYHAIGLVSERRLLVVVFVDRSSGDEQIIRIISARRAEDYEQKTYARQFTEGD